MQKIVVRKIVRL